MKIILTALLLTISSIAFAESRYVDDHLIITMRTGKANTYQILRTIPSGTQLELLQVDGEYSRVRTPDGVEGWVLSQYLTKTPIARVRLAKAEKQLERLRQEKQQLEQQLASLQAEKSTLAKEHTDLGNETEQLRGELDKLREVAAHPVELAQQNQELSDKVSNLNKQLELVQQANDELKDHSRRDWFLAGGGVLFGGILLGLLLPMLRRKKRGMFE